MSIKRLVAVKNGGRKQLLGVDNIMALCFIVIVICFAIKLGYGIFGWFTIGILIVRLAEVIFEMKEYLFDRPFFHYLIMVGIPAQALWSYYR